MALPPLSIDSELFRLLVENATDYAIFMLDPSGCVLTWNEGARRIKGYSAQEIVGQHFSCFYTQEDIQAGRPADALEGARIQGRFEEEGWRLRKDGSGFWASVVIAPLVGADGHLHGFSKITRDITARKEAELALAEIRKQVDRRSSELAAANAELESFTYAVSHDLQAPLRRMRGFVELLHLRHKSDLPEQGRRYLDRIDVSANQMSCLIDDLLAFSRLGCADVGRQPIDLNLLQEEARRQICGAGGGKDQERISWVVGKLPEVVGDRSMIRLALVNLFSNAMKFARSRADSRIEIGCSECSAEQATVFVRDNGVGFDMKYAGRLFQVFQRLHSDEFEGTGVGLATVRRIVERHGGRVWADSKENQGATFYLTLPRAGGNLTCV